MSDRYFSRVYKGLLMQQTDRGWIVPQLPNWSNGPVPQGPFSTYGIAEHVIDRVLDNDLRSQQQKNPVYRQESVPESNYSYSESSSGGFFSNLFQFVFWMGVIVFLMDVFSK